MPEVLEVPSGHPLLIFFASFPIACFTGALMTDIAYVQTAEMMWADFSAWLLLVGNVGAALAALIGLIVLARRRHGVPHRRAWPAVLGALVVLALGTLDNLVHSRDAWTSVMPEGLGLSILTVLAMLVTLYLATRRRRIIVPVMPVEAPL